ncbi:uncharacterized protein LOC113088586 [Carassius auratus]|uniref:Uncharacterized protein LOC113088586 n=1 Tax=Carassius auratus TaxID=7957 RepID=A0A6P6NSL6_CARAU|nr:uncharacterized protein LOC113088586 [Carassius auratus]XP_026111564.1 uncharacterized protein LOC113088586 [Carassius auratus]
MKSVNAVQLFILVWTFTAVCKADEDVIVSCYDVTGSVGKEVNLTCSVSLNITECCITMYKFHYSETDNDSAICRQDVSVNSCEQRNSFTCPYTPPKAMTEQLRFFVQTNCGTGKEVIFILNTVSSGRVNPVNPSGSSPPETAAGFKGTVITVAVASFIIIIIFIMMVIIRQTKPNSTKLCRRQNWMFLRVRHDEDNSRPGNVIL